MSAEGNHVRLTLSRPGFALDVDFVLPRQGVTVLFGPSGSGKTTILRCVAGLERARAGRVRIGEETWQDESARLFVPTWRRPLGYVFQEASLFEHLDVEGNLRYGLRRRRASHGAQALDAAIELLGIAQLLRRRPAQLSGGERQRVAIGRALAADPRLLLLDEPLSALDRARKQEILPWLERLRDELRVPILYVTHAVDELARLAAHIVVLEGGRVTAAGAVREVLTSAEMSLLLGDDAGAMLEGRIGEREAQWHLCRVEFEGGSLWLRDTGLPVGQAVRLRVLARDVSLTTEEPWRTSIQNHLPGVVQGCASGAHPSQVLVQIGCGPSTLLAQITRRAWDALGLRTGQQVWVQVKSVALVQ